VSFLNRYPRIKRCWDEHPVLCGLLVAFLLCPLTPLAVVLLFLYWLTNEPANLFGHHRPTI